MEVRRGPFPLCPFKRGATGAEVPLLHRCRSRQIFWVQRILPEFPQTCPKSFLCNLCLQIFSHKIMKTSFWCNLQKKIFMCFHVNLGRHFLKSNDVGHHFHPDFQGFCPDFQQIKNLWGCSCNPCTPPSNTTAFHNSIIGNLMVYQDRLEKYLLQLFRHPENSEWFSIISVITFEVSIVDGQKQTKLVTIF